jgi:hypothetical protein
MSFGMANPHLAGVGAMSRALTAPAKIDRNRKGGRPRLCDIRQYKRHWGEVKSSSATPSGAWLAIRIAR